MTTTSCATDVAIVGGGLAGWTAARRCQAAGLRVILVDKGESPGRSNSRMSQGFLNAAYLPMQSDPEELLAYGREITAGAARDELLDAWAHTCGRAVEWLKVEGLPLGELAEKQNRLYMLPFHPTPNGLKDYDRTRGPDAALTGMAASFVSAGGTYLEGFHAQDLIIGQRVNGLRGRTASGEIAITASAVVIADGGFQANPELLRRHVGPAADRMKLRSMDSQTGDGLSMGQAAGAALVNEQYFYGHMLSLSALENDTLWPYPILGDVVCRGILVGRDGRRFVDEQLCGEGASRPALSDVGVTNVVGRSADPRGPVVILDSVGWQAQAEDERRGAFQGLVPPCDTIRDAGGQLFVADDIGTLADRTGIRRSALVETVEDWNDAVREDRAASLAVPRSGPTPAILEPPFFAVPTVAGITFTMGGLLINAGGQVLDAAAEAIPGLYAAGGAMGGLMGGPKGGYLGGLSQALVFGLLAAEQIAREVASIELLGESASLTA